MWRYLKFLHMQRNFRFSTQQMWRNLKFCQNLRNFKCLHMTDVKKCEIYPVFCCKICFVTIYAVFCKIRDVAIYALLGGEKLSPKLYGWRKNDKYEVCAQSVFNIQKKRTKLPELGGWGRGGGVWVIRAMPEIKHFFPDDVFLNRDR